VVGVDSGTESGAGVGDSFGMEFLDRAQSVVIRITTDGSARRAAMTRAPPMPPWRAPRLRRTTNRGAPFRGERASTTPDGQITRQRGRTPANAASVAIHCEMPSSEGGRFSHAS
jgi:hypothetical protein